MLANLRFLGHLNRGRFQEALAQLDPGGWPSSGLEVWVCYKLGLFRMVNCAGWHGDQLRGAIGQAVSFSASGMFEEADQRTREILAKGRARKLHFELAVGLAPYMPGLALEVIERCRTDHLMQIALLYRTGNLSAAKRALEIAKNTNSRASPEVPLLTSNVMGGEPQEQLDRLNAFFASYSLPPLQLLRRSAPPNPTNVAVAAELPKVRGPLVSVLVTTYNNAELIEHAVSSLLNQTWENLEIVVVDDASEDDTGAAVRKLASKDPRVTYVRLETNVGTYVAKTVGFHHSTGQYVTCHDSDDWAHPLRIQLQVQALLADTSVVASTSQWLRMEADGTFYARQVFPLLRLNPASVMFRRSDVFKRAGLWDAVRTGADSEFIARLMLVFGRNAIARLSLPLSLGAHRPDSLMTSTDTGYCIAGMSPQRLAYWEAWTRWHIAELHAGRVPCLPAITSSCPEARPFAAPASLAVDIGKTFTALGLDVSR